MAEMARRLSDDSIIVADASYASIWIANYLPARKAGMRFLTPRGMAGLGWGLPMALGAKLARPDRQVMAVVGDGAFMFSNPAAVHHAAALHDLPILFVVMNNAMWGAVQRSTLAMYADGVASRSNAPSFVQLEKLPEFERICEAAGGYGERVDDPAALPAALERAMSVVKNERRQALLNVICGPGGTA